VKHRSLIDRYKAMWRLHDRARELQRAAHDNMLAAVPESEEYYAGMRAFSAAALVLDDIIAALKKFGEHLP
jgi:hypothetical protein